MGVIATVFLPRLGDAHTPGLSMAELQVDAQGSVEARLTFASAEAPRGFPLRQEDLRGFVLDGVDVVADGERCDPKYGGSSLTDGDGLLLEATFTCPPDATEIEATLYYLSGLPPGHRVIARIVGPPGTPARVEGVLTADRRGLALQLPRSGTWTQRARRIRRWQLGAAFTVAFALLVFSFVRGCRRSRGRRQETPPPPRLTKVG